MLGDEVKVAGAGLSSDRMWNKLHNKVHISMVKLYSDLGLGILTVFSYSHTMITSTALPNVWGFHSKHL